MKYAWIDAQRREFPLPDLCEVLTVSASDYRAWKRGGKPDRTRLTDPQAVALIKSIHVEVKAAYGSRRIHRELQGRDHRIGLRRVETLMRETGIRARHKRRQKATTDSKHAMPVAANLLASNFTPAGQTECGRAISPTSRPAKARCTWPSCWTCSTGRSWAGRSSRA